MDSSANVVTKKPVIDDNPNDIQIIEYNIPPECMPNTLVQTVGKTEKWAPKPE